jgi:hypothetical protein
VQIRLIFLFFLLSNLTLAQQWDSLNFVLPTDTLLQQSIQKADSVILSFQSKTDSLNALFQDQFSKIDSTRNHLQSKIDSLNNLSLSTEKLTGKLDSLNRVKDQQISTLTRKVEDLKSKATQGLKEIQLPPQLQEPMQKVQASVQSYKLPTLNTSTPGISSLEMPKSGNTILPTLTSQLALDPNLKGITGNLNEITDIANQAGQYTEDAQHLVKGNLNEVKNIDKTIEAKVAGMEGVDQLAEGKALMTEYTQLDSAALKNKAKELVQEQVMNLAQDHFAGKQEALQQAMSKMSKLKSKYPDVKSMAELPRKLPNPLKGKPFIERLVPALSFQIQTSQYFLLDVNPVIMYLISPRFSAGAGWNQRFAFDGTTIKKEASVYGPRLAFEFKWTKGINFRLLPEIMNTTIPPFMAQSKGVDPAYREWVGSLFIGIKKDFTVYRKIKGYTEVLYNIYDPNDLSPYGDEISIRFGFEYGMKKKIRK